MNSRTLLLRLILLPSNPQLRFRPPIATTLAASSSSAAASTSGSGTKKPKPKNSKPKPACNDEILRNVNEESDWRNVLAAHAEWECEQQLERTLRHQHDRLQDLRALHAFILHGPAKITDAQGLLQPNPLIVWQPLGAEAEAECAQVLAYFEERMAAEKTRAEAASASEEKWRLYRARASDPQLGYKRLYLRALYRLLRAVYRDSRAMKEETRGKRAQQAQTAELARLNAVLDHEQHLMTEQKRQCLLGALWLADGRVLHFFDWLSTRCERRELGPGHVEFLCRVATAAKETSILEPLTNVASQFLPPGFSHMSNVYNALVTIYDLTDQCDKMDAICEHIAQQHGIPHPDLMTHLRPLLHRIATFYRKNNRRPPPHLGPQIRGLRRNSQPYFVANQLLNQGEEERKEGAR